MKYTVLTLFPEITDAFFATSIMAKAIKRGIIEYQAVNIRDFAHDKHKTCDDAPYGGGPGMIMLPEPLSLALKSVGVNDKEVRLSESSGIRGQGSGIRGSCTRAEIENNKEKIANNNPQSQVPSPKSLINPQSQVPNPTPQSQVPSPQSPAAKQRVIYLTPSGRPFNQKLAQELAKEKELVLICGRYEGIDQRIIDRYVDDEISVGDYVLSSGEAAALAVIDATYRLVDNVICADSLAEESFSDGLLEYPQFTRPEVFDTMKVPEVLLSGHHEQIRLWRLEKRVEKTLRQRPDMIQRGIEFGIFNDEIKSIIDRMVKAEGEENERN